ADLHRTDDANRPLLRELITARGIGVVVYMACQTSEVSLRWLRSLGVRTLNQEQDSFPPDAGQRLVKKLAKRLLRRHLRWNLHDLYVAHAEHQRQFLLSFACLPPERVVTVVNGIDTTLFTPGPAPDPAELGLPKTQHYAVAVCQARPEKRVEFLMDV